MNIGFLFIHPPKESMGSIIRLRDLCSCLSKLGHTSYIFTPYDFDENWGDKVFFKKVTALANNSKFSIRLYKVTRLILNRPFFARNIMLHKRTLTSVITRLSAGLLSYLQKEKIQLDMIQGEQEIGALAVCRIKNKLKIPVIADMHNYWPEELISEGIIKPGHKQHKFLIELEQEIFSNSDYIFASSQNFVDYLIQNFKIDKSKISALFPGGNPIHEHPFERASPPRVIFSGLVVQRANVELFVQAIPYIKKECPEAKCYMTRKGELIPHVEALAKQLNVEIEFYWFDKFKDYLDFLSKSSVGIVPSANTLPRKFGVAGKIFDFFAVGVPVVANDVHSWTQLITDNEVGIVTTDDPKDVAKAVVKFLKDPKYSKECGERGIQLVKGSSNWMNITKKEFIPFAEKLMKK